MFRIAGLLLWDLILTILTEMGMESAVKAERANIRASSQEKVEWGE